MDEYAILAWSDLETIVKDNTTNEVIFMQNWSSKVVSHFPDLNQADIMALFDSADWDATGHQSNERVREYWKYGTSIGVNGTPTAFINGVKMESAPWLV